MPTAPNPATAAAPDPRAARPSFQERLSALRNLPPFLREIWRTSRPLTITTLGLRLVRALMPVVMLYIGKLIIDEAIGLVGTGVVGDGFAEAWRSGLLGHPRLLQAAHLGMAIPSGLTST